jgi:hypothetical protein
MFFFDALLCCKAVFYLLSLRIYVSCNTSKTTDRTFSRLLSALNISQLADSLIKLFVLWPLATWTLVEIVPEVDRKYCTCLQFENSLLHELKREKAEYVECHQ